MATYEILIADDHPLFRSALHQALTLGLGPDVRLVEVASIAELETRLTEKADWDLVLLDLNMPGAYGFSGWCCCAASIRKFLWSWFRPRKKRRSW